MFFRQIVDSRLSQYAYLVGCTDCGEAVVIDPERDVDRYRRVADEEGLRIVAAAETHIHADFLSGARAFAEAGVRVLLSGEGDEDWRHTWPEPGSHDVVRLRDGETFRVGSVEIRALHTPGHTPEHLCYLVTDRASGNDEPMGVLTGDFLFVGDVGRPDLLESATGMEGAMRRGAEALHASLERFLELPDWLQVWPGHGAGSACGKGMSSVPHGTVGWERRTNPAVEAARGGLEAFVEHVLGGQLEPPVYFGPTKVRNREGPALLEALPRPREVLSSDIPSLLEDGDGRVAVVDAREARSGFMAGHLPGALHAPLDDSFPTIAGSYLEEDARVVLVLDEHRVEEAVRCLVRVGRDRVEGYIRPHALEAHAERGGRLDTIEEIGVEAMEDRRRDATVVVLDVRSLSEYEEGHVPGSLHVPHTRLPARLEDLPGERELLVHCSTGVRSAAAAAFLASRGYDVVWIDGAIADWLERNEAEEGSGLRGRARVAYDLQPL